MAGVPCDSAGLTSACIPASQGASFVPGHTTPDSRVLAGVHRPCQTGLRDHTVTTDDLRLFDLQKRRVSVPNREEQLGTHVQACGAVAPRHQDRAPPSGLVGLGIVLVSSRGACFGITVLLRCHRDRAGGSSIRSRVKLLRVVVTNRHLRVFKIGLAKKT